MAEGKKRRYHYKTRDVKILGVCDTNIMLCINTIRLLSLMLPYAQSDGNTPVLNRVNNWLIVSIVLKGDKFL